MKLKDIQAGVALAGATIAVLILSAAPAMAASSDCPTGQRFCAYNSASFAGIPYQQSSGTYSDNAQVETTDDILSSGINRYTSAKWCSWTAGPVVHILLDQWAASTSIGTLQGDNQADYFRVQTSGGC